MGVHSWNSLEWPMVAWEEHVDCAAVTADQTS